MKKVFNGTRRNVSIVAALLLAAMQTGCSIAKALSGPPPVSVERIKAGENRNVIISLLGIPQHTESGPNGKTDIYEFVDGYSGGSKVRVILYIAGDVFTLGLSELVFWPIELAADGGSKGRAIVTYGPDDISKAVLLTGADGSPWRYATPTTTTTEVYSMP